MSRNISTCRRPLGAVMVGAAMVLALAGCNDNPGDRGRMSISLSDLQRQLGLIPGGGDGTNTAIGADASPATTVPRALILGPIVVRAKRTPGPYTLNEGLTDALRKDLENDVTQSVSFIVIQDLPTPATSIEFLAPPETAGNWQVGAVAYTQPIATLANVSDETVSASLAYYGFTDTFLRTATLGTTAIPLKMQRACLLDTPPKGCAQFDDVGNGIVKASVEIWGVYKYPNGLQTSTTKFGGTNRLTTSQIVRASPGSGEVSESTAVTALNTARTLAGGNTTGDTLAVVATHRQAANYADTSATGVDCTGSTFGDTSKTNNTAVQARLADLANRDALGTSNAALAAALDACFQIYTTPYQ
ncbi:MAG: hypothetical protein HY423_12190 [Candidatus Lambdaproteobacteria bacterium]|nr:hypothetical protein [Candidatus Lambdaproteobacteria bacterium]